MKPKWEKGQFVVSHYHAAWKGIVIEVTERKGTNPLLKIVPLLTKTGAPQPRRQVQTLDAGWVTKIPPLNITINPDWI